MPSTNLTNPIVKGRTAIQYTLDTIALDFNSKTIAIQVSFIDDKGQVINTEATRVTFADANLDPIPLALVNALVNKIRDALVVKSIVN